MKDRLNNVNKTLYIPLYGKAYVSKRSLFLKDPKAEEIWEAEQFPLKGKAASKWLALYMGIRTAVFDGWLKEITEGVENATVIHIGCGMDSRILRVGSECLAWYDVDFPEVIKERKRYYTENGSYKMISADIRNSGWLSEIPENKKAVVVMEGVSMYLTLGELQTALKEICDHFDEVEILMDCYTVLAAKMSKYKNPINDVGVTSVYGIDDPLILQTDGLVYVKEHNMIPQKYVDELQGREKLIFAKLYGGGLSKRLYKLYEFKKYAK
jgi:O-methyltransferase involved in polyketide biosynthesis